MTRFLSSLSNRIFLASALLALMAIGAAMLVVNAVVTAQAEAELERGLEEAATLVDGYHREHFDALDRDARLIADLPKLKAAVDTNDPPTVLPIVEAYPQQLGADLFLVTNRAGMPLATIGDPGAGAEAIRELPAIRAALAGRTSSSFWPRGNGVLQVVVSTPIWIEPVPEILGTLSVGFSLDEALAKRFKQLTQADIVMASPTRVYAATLDVTPPALLEALRRSRGRSEKSSVARVTLEGEDYVAVTRELPLNRASATAGDGGADPVPLAMVLQSRTERLRPLRTVHTALVVTALLAVVGATLLSYLVARTITRPLAAITATMRDVAVTGDLTRASSPPSSGWWEDEDARLLARTFESLASSLARFQREAALRERLSTLGRFSTVLAHEIRNPLMIIKASLHTLKRSAFAPTALRRDKSGAAASPLPPSRSALRRDESAVVLPPQEELSPSEIPEWLPRLADIEEEVNRLDRLVGEVLDYARPLRFSYETVDLSTVCRGAAEASTRGHDVKVVVAAPPEPLEIVTDAERLRAALVNILANAREAVLTRRADEARVTHPVTTKPTPPEDKGAELNAMAITLEVRQDRPSRVRVVVADRGTGIAEEDLPRVFEPYFTTRRTGSGLGLAIARHIVEGLGGTIELASRQGEGTTVTIALPVDSRA
ncbi:MAG: HAMP domain-containing protein [Luteitalea sp.]|nr:HAMP domain-containing protein [Luteitalea sp.]